MDMGLTGLIFGGIAAAWLIYLVPYILHRRSDPDALLDDPEEPFSASVTIVRRGTDLAAPETGAAQVSTPLMRRALIYDLKRIDARAALRRRRVLGVLIVIVTVTSSAVVLSAIPWWSIPIAASLVIGFLVLARVHVRRMRRELATRAQQIIASGNEQTVPIKVLDPATVDATPSLVLAPPTSTPTSLWDPIPITQATYVSTPLAPRTVRTIDLSAPVVAKTSVPVVAEALTETIQSDERQASGQ